MAWSERRGSGRRPMLLALVAAAATLPSLLAASEAGAAKPELGLWQGTGPNGELVSFQVMRAQDGSDRAATYATFGCTVAGLESDSTPYGWGTELGDPTGADLDRPHASGIGRHGRLVQGTSSGSDSLYGQLGKRSGYVTRKYTPFPGACEGEDDVRVRVHHAGDAVSPVSGVWSSLTAVGTFRFLVFGSLVDDYAGQALTGIGALQGAPVPCVGLIGGFFGHAQAPAWIDAAGSYSWTIGDDWLRAQLTGQTSLGGWYMLPSTSPQPTGATNCVDAPQAFTASLEEAGPAPRWHGSKLVDAGGEPPPPPPPLPIPTQPTEYVALGDSYSSGEGVPPFEEGTDERGNRCHRSTRAYSQRFSPPGYAMGTTFLACSGATSINLGRLINGSWVAIPQKGETAAQLAALTLEEWRPTDLITVTLGGNDARFDKVLKRCMLRPAPCHHGEWADEVEQRIATEIPTALTETYAAIRSRVPIRQGPNATVIVLGYPQLFPADPEERCTFRKRLWLRKGEQDWLRERGEQLNGVIQATASHPDLRFHYVDVTNAFSDHEVCGPDGDWIHGLVPKAPPKHRYSFHPNGRGQQAYTDRLLEYFGCLYTSGFRFRPSGVPFNPGGPNGLTVLPECVVGRE